MRASAKDHRGAGSNRHILARIYHIYITLHQGTASTPIAFSASPTDGDRILLGPSSYPLCTIAGHHPGSAPHIHTDVVGTVGLPVRAEMTSSSPIFGGDNTILDFDTPTDALSFYTPSPGHAHSHPTNGPPLDDMPAAPLRCSSVTAPSCPLLR